MDKTDLISICDCKHTEQFRINQWFTLLPEAMTLTSTSSSKYDRSIGNFLQCIRIGKNVNIDLSKHANQLVDDVISEYDEDVHIVFINTMLDFSPSLILSFDDDDTSLIIFTSCNGFASVINQCLGGICTIFKAGDIYAIVRERCELYILKHPGWTLDVKLPRWNHKFDKYLGF